MWAGILDFHATFFVCLTICVHACYPFHIFCSRQNDIYIDRHVLSRIRNFYIYFANLFEVLASKGFHFVSSKCVFGRFAFCVAIAGFPPFLNHRTDVTTVQSRKCFKTISIVLWSVNRLKETDLWPNHIFYIQTDGLPISVFSEWKTVRHILVTKCVQNTEKPYKYYRTGLRPVYPFWVMSV
jgi:hypothetical protein